MGMYSLRVDICRTINIKVEDVFAEDDEILEEVAAIQENAGQNPGGNRDFRDFRNRRPNEFVPRPNPGTGNAGPGNTAPMVKQGTPATNTQGQNQSKVWVRPTFEEMRQSRCWKCGLKDHMKEKYTL